MRKNDDPRSRRGLYDGRGVHEKDILTYESKLPSANLSLLFGSSSLGWYDPGKAESKGR